MREPLDTDFVRITDYIPGIAVDLRGLYDGRDGWQEIIREFSAWEAEKRAEALRK